MPLSAGQYRGRLGSQAYPRDFLRQYDRTVYLRRLSGLGALVPMPQIQLGRVRRIRRVRRSVGLLRLFGL